MALLPNNYDQFSILFFIQSFRLNLDLNYIFISFRLFNSSCRYFEHDVQCCTKREPYPSDNHYWSNWEYFWSWIVKPPLWWSMGGLTPNRSEPNPQGEKCLSTYVHKKIYFEWNKKKLTSQSWPWEKSTGKSYKNYIYLASHSYKWYRKTKESFFSKWFLHYILRLQH